MRHPGLDRVGGEVGVRERRNVIHSKPAMERNLARVFSLAVCPALHYPTASSTDTFQNKQTSPPDRT
jgi:hypothetical protein